MWRLLLISFVFFLTGCAHSPAKNMAISPLQPGNITQQRPVLAFTQVIIEGRVNAHLHTGYAKPQVILKGDRRDVAHAIVIVKHNTLLVNLPAGYPKFGALTADIRGHSLRSFTYRGAGTVTGKHINSSLLDVFITNPGRTTLGGHINLHNIEVQGPGYTEISGIKTHDLQLKMTGHARVQLIGIANISRLTLDGDGSLGMYWVKSDTLTLRGRGHTFVQLGGIANKLDVELWNYARFNGRYLRSKQTFVKTHDHAVAEISSLDKQHTLATDASDIYFYELPKTKADFMAFNGAVLDMRDWNNPFIDAYTRYNQ